MQRPTCSNVHIRTPADARLIFHAVHLGILPMITRRLDADERARIEPGSVYVWEERSPQSDLTGVGIERWTDGIAWGPSRVRDGFLFYQEKPDKRQIEPALWIKQTHRQQADLLLNKQTYTVFVNVPGGGQRKWHLIAYFTGLSLDALRTVTEIPDLYGIQVPPNLYPSARHPKGRPEHIFNSPSPSYDNMSSPSSPTYSMAPASPSSESQFIMWSPPSQSSQRPPMPPLRHQYASHPPHSPAPHPPPNGGLPLMQGRLPSLQQTRTNARREAIDERYIQALTYGTRIY